MTIHAEVNGFLQELVVGFVAFQPENTVFTHDPGQLTHFTDQIRWPIQAVGKSRGEGQTKGAHHRWQPELDQGDGKGTA